MSEQNNPESEKFNRQALEATDRIIRGFGPRRIGATILGWQDTEHEPHKKIEARQFQIDAWNAIADHRSTGSNEALLYMATGLGKTTVVAGDIANFADERRMDGKPAPKVLFLAHQTPLLDQAQDRLAGLLPDMSSTLMKGGSTPNPRADITFATLQSMNLHKDDYEPDTFDYVVVDESHHAMADTFAKTIDYFESEFRLGVTATPFRKDEKDLAHLFGETVYTKNLVDAISERLLVSPRYTVISDKIIHTAIDNDFKSLKELNMAIFQKRRNDKIARIIQEAQTAIKNSRTIVFASRITHANEFVDLLPDARAFHSELKEDEQIQNLRDFRDGKFSTIVTVDKFNEGVDIPEANLAVFLRATGSRRIFEQQLGRVLRPADGKESTHILDFVGTAERLKLLYDLSREIRLRRTGGESSDIEDERDFTGEFGIKFTEEQIDIVKRINDLIEKGSAPEGWLSTNSLSKKLKVTVHQIERIAAQLDIQPKYLSSKSASGYYYSPEQQEAIFNETNRYGWADDSYITPNKLAEALGVSRYLVDKTAEELGISSEVLHEPNGRLSNLYPPLDQEAILEAIANKYVSAPEGYLPVTPLAERLGVGTKSIERAAGILGIRGSLMRSRAGSHIPGVYYSPDEQLVIEEFLIRKDDEYAPDNYSSTLDISGLTNYSYSVVVRVAEQLGIEGTKLRKRNAGGVMTTVYSPNETRLIIEELNRIPRVLEGYLPAQALAKKLGIDRKNIATIASQAGVNGQKMRGPSRVTTYYSPNEQTALEEYLKAQNGGA